MRRTRPWTEKSKEYPIVKVWPDKSASKRAHQICQSSVVGLANAIFQNPHRFPVFSGRCPIQLANVQVRLTLVNLQYPQWGADTLDQGAKRIAPLVGAVSSTPANLGIRTSWSPRCIVFSPIRATAISLQPKLAVAYTYISCTRDGSRPTEGFLYEGLR